MNTPRQTNRYLMAPLAIALAWPAGAGADGVVSACVKKSGQVRIVGTGVSCRRVERLMRWNIEGPPGPQGPAGPMGPPGPEGPPGQGGGLGGLERVEYSTAKNTLSPKNVFAKCPAGKKAIGGGAQAYTVGSKEGDVAIKKSFPSDALDGWAATAVTALNTNWYLTAYAICVTAP